MLPSIDSLRCFVEAAQLLNFRAAARAVALTPAALGQRIRQLEDQVGDRLFARTTRRVALTEAGLRLLPYARRAVASSEECLRAARGELGPAPMDVVIGTRHELGMSYLVPLLPRIEKEHPRLTVHLYFGSGADLMLRIRAVQIDCAITSTRLTDPKLDAFPVHREDYAFVASAKLLRRRPFTSAAAAAQHVLIDTNEELPLFRYWRDAAGGFDSTRFQSVRRVGTIAAILALVLRGEGVAVLPEYFVARDLTARRLMRLFPRVKPEPDHFRLVFRSDDPRRSLFEAISRTLASVPLH